MWEFIAVDYRIWKFELQITDMQTKKMPVGAKILSVANQNGSLCLWAMCDTKKPGEDRVIEIIGTGNPVHMDMGVERTFIGTVVMNPFVWHVFERV